MFNGPVTGPTVAEGSVGETSWQSSIVFNVTLSGVDFEYRSWNSNMATSYPET